VEYIRTIILGWHTKNDECSFASVIFFVVVHGFVLGSSIRQSRIVAEGLPLAGNGKFPFYQIFLRLSFAGQFPLAGNGKFPSKERLVVIFFEILFNAKTTFSCVSGIKWLLTSSVTVESLCPMPDKNKTNRGLTASF